MGLNKLESLRNKPVVLLIYKEFRIMIMIGTMLFYRLEFINVCESAYVADKWYENINIVKIII